jgi:hypothetical protein
MKLYIHVNENGEYAYKAFTNYESAKGALFWIQSDYHHWRLDFADLPFIGRSVCYVEDYRGYDYIFGEGMEHVCTYSKIYACANHAKSYDPSWKGGLEAIQNSGRETEFIIRDNLLASRDSTFNDKPFVHGDVMEGKFRVMIKRIRVDKRTIEDLGYPW